VQGSQGPAGLTVTPYVNVSANYTILGTDHTVFCNASNPGGNRTITLPAANLNGGRMFAIRRVNTTGSNCIVTPVQGGSVTLSGNPGAIIVQSNGTTWYVISESDI
jgi:hypothetical protein